MPRQERLLKPRGEAQEPKALAGSAFAQTTARQVKPLLQLIRSGHKAPPTVGQRP
jgi:hypothetical protein